MNQTEIKNILKSRYLEFSGYKNSEIKKMNLKKQATGFTFTLAPIIVLFIFTFIALFFALGLSFFKGPFTLSLDKIEFDGLGNFERLKTDAWLLTAIKNSLRFAAITVPISLLSSLFVAFALNTGKVHGKKAFLIIYFLPQLTAVTATTIIFYTVFSEVFGTLQNPSNKFYIIIVMALWGQISGGLVTFNTAFTNLGSSQYEASKLDGANAWTRFWKITIPSLMPIITYSLIMGLIGGMATFGESYMFLSNGYANPEEVITWATLGFLRVQPGNSTIGISPALGLGILELVLLGLTTTTLSLISNIFFPIAGKKRKGH